MVLQDLNLTPIADSVSGHTLRWLTYLFDSCIFLDHCIPKGKECDRIKDCANGFDEEDCAYRNCDPATQFFCSGRCWPNDLLCDGWLVVWAVVSYCLIEIAFPSVSHYRRSISGTRDCDDGFDESNCTRLHYHGDCLKTQYECDNGRYDMSEPVIVCSLDFCLNSGTFPMFQ